MDEDFPSVEMISAASGVLYTGEEEELKTSG